MAYAELSVTDSSVIEVGTQWTESELVKQVPGSRWDGDRKLWTVPFSWAACVMLRGIFADALAVGERLNERVWNERRDRIDPATELRDLEEWPSGWAHGAVPVYADHPLRSFQEVDALFMVTAGEGVLLGNTMGTGKTISTLASLDALGDDALPALVICPNSVKKVWNDHVPVWLPRATPYVVRGGAVGRRRVLQAAREDPDAVVITNIESVRLLSRLAPYGSVKLARCRECDRRHGDPIPASRCEVHRKELNEFGFKTAIIDEAHRIKNPLSKQTRAVWAAVHNPSVRRRWALTGTPIANHVGDLWAIMHAVAPREYPTRGHFVDRYALQAWNAHGGLDIVGINPQTRDEFFTLFHPRFRRMTKDRVLPQLPAKIYEPRHVELSPKQLAAYREIERTAFTVLDDGQVLVAAGNLVGRTRMLQFCSSYAELVPDPRPDDPERTRVVLSEPSPKLDELLLVLDELGLGEPVVVAAESRQLIELASARLRRHDISHGLIVGGMTDDERDLVIRRFQDDRIRAVLMTMQAGGTGVDGLQHASVLVRLQRSWSMLVNSQTEDRVHRIGSEVHDSVTIIDIVAAGTVEETVQLPRLEEKRRRLQEITRDRAELRRTRPFGTGDDLAALDAEEMRILHSDLGLPAGVDLLEEEPE